MSLLERAKIKFADLVNDTILEMRASEKYLFYLSNNELIIKLDREFIKEGYNNNEMDIFLNLKRNIELKRTIKKSYPLFLLEKNLFFYLPIGCIKEKHDEMMDISFFKDRKLINERYLIVKKYSCCIAVKNVKLGDKDE